MEIKNLRKVQDPYATCKYTVVLDKDDLAKLERLDINFCSLKESKGRTWVNLLSLKERDGPAEGEYVHATVPVGLEMSDIMEKVKEGLRTLENKPSGDSSDLSDIPF